MKPRAKKAKSKRTTLKDKYAVQRKVREHNRKQRRQERLEGKTKLKKDPGVPKLHPFKHEIIQDIEDAKQKQEELKQRQKLARQQRANEKRRLGAKSEAELAAIAAQRAATYEALNAANGTSDGFATAASFSETSRKAFYREFKKVVEAADVVLQVLDARDPLGCRSPHVEQAVLSAGGRKRLVLVLNKIDLVPKEVVEKWLTYLRNEFPTVAFKAATQSQRSNIAQSTSTSLSNTGDSACHGAGVLMKLLGNYCRNLNIKTAIRVGIVGYPNVGKSSIINSLKRSKACNVGSTPGLTRSVQEVSLDKHIKLLDSPGIVMADSRDVSLVLRNCVRVDSIEDTVAPVEHILSRCNKAQIMERYEVPMFNSAVEFLQYLARKLGKLKKGGIPDINAAGKVLLQDWNNGNISYYTRPPEAKQHVSHVSTRVKSELGAEFDIDALLQEEQQDVLTTLRSEKECDDYVMITDAGMPTESGFEGAANDAGDMMDEDQNDGSEQIGTEIVATMKPKKQKAAAAASASAVKAMDDEEDALNPQTNKQRKKLLKEQKRAQKKAASLEASGDGDNDAYDFATDFVAAQVAQPQDDDESDDDDQDFFVEGNEEESDDDDMGEASELEDDEL